MEKEETVNAETVLLLLSSPLRKHAYSNILNISPPKKKKWKFSDKNSDIFHISA